MNGYGSGTARASGFGPSTRTTWAYDFVTDRTANGKAFRLLTVVDEYTRECLAILELFVNLQNKRQLARYVKSRISIPETLVVELETEHAPAFVRDPEGFDTRGYGDRWLREAKSCVLRVPSRVVVEEFNYLINPVHRSFSEIRASTETYQADPRLLG